MNTKISTHFKLSEVRCHCGCGYSLIDKDLLTKLELARTIATVPFTINSWCRCGVYNDSLPNSVLDSAHLTGKAVDIRVLQYDYQIILKALRKAGFKRIGKGKNFIHCDVDENKPQVEWRYK